MSHSLGKQKPRRPKIRCQCKRCIDECGPQGKEVTRYIKAAHLKASLRASSSRRQRSSHDSQVAAVGSNSWYGTRSLSSAGDLSYGNPAVSPFQLQQPGFEPGDDAQPLRSHNDTPSISAITNEGEIDDVDRNGDHGLTVEHHDEPMDVDSAAGVALEKDLASMHVSKDVAEIPEHGGQGGSAAESPNSPALDPSVALQQHNEVGHGPEIVAQADGDDLPSTQRGEASPSHADIPPDPFDLEAPACGADVLSEATSFWFWRIILLTTTWLHIHFHLPHMGCTLLLKVLRLIFVMLGILPRNNRVPITLTTSFKRLGLNDESQIHPVCPTSHRVYPSSTSSTERCLHCDEPLFKSSGDDSSTSPNSGAPRPRLQCPKNPISASILRFVWQDENERLCDQWRKQAPHPGIKTCIQDGEVWKTLPGHDGKLFFDNSTNRTDCDELRLGLTLGFDGFSYERSQQSGTHSSGVMSLAVANLPNNLKYRPRNLMLYGITPGPKEFTTRELQFFMKELVDDLIRLYENGLFIKTPLYPEGRRIRVVLVAVCCDHPAMCKVCGFADHRKEEGFCPRCHIKHSQLRTAEAMTNGFQRRTGVDHKWHANEYAKLTNPTDQDQYFSTHSARYFELSRLSYFDPVRMSVFDPMHNILLGVVKTQWYDGWIQTKALRQRTSTRKVARELDRIHDYLQDFEMPSWVARLPQQVGYPAAGSLGADEWKGMALVYCPVVIPMIWDEWLPSSVDEIRKASERWEKNEAMRQRRLASGRIKPGDSQPAPKPVPRMLEGDDENFLKLAAALKIILGRTVRDVDIPRAQSLLYDYLLGFLRLHPDCVKPNHHWVTHIFDQIDDYGPVYGFWTFMFERLNKILKSYSTNNHGQGEIEVSFMRAFLRDAALRRLMGSVQASVASKGDNASDEDRCEVEAVELLLATDADVRGTVASLANEVESNIKDYETRYSRGPFRSRTLLQAEQRDLLSFYTHAHPDAAVMSLSNPSAARDANFLSPRAKFHDYIIVNGRRIVPSSSFTRAPDSIIQTIIDGEWFAGQVQYIVSHFQYGVPGSETTLLGVRWFRRLQDADTRHWAPYPELEIYFWEYGIFTGEDDGPPNLIPVDSILSQACRLTLRRLRVQDTHDSDDDEDPSEQTMTSRLWATVGLTRDISIL